MAGEVIFLIEEAPEGGFTAKALDHSIFTEADTWAELREAIRDAVACHFEASEVPPLIRLHYVREEVTAHTKPTVATGHFLDRLSYRRNQS
jgi:hypothetical protein